MCFNLLSHALVLFMNYLNVIHYIPDQLVMVFDFKNSVIFPDISLLASLDLFRHSTSSIITFSFADSSTMLALIDSYRMFLVVSNLSLFIRSQMCQYRYLQWRSQGGHWGHARP